MAASVGSSPRIRCRDSYDARMHVASQNAGEPSAEGSVLCESVRRAAARATVAVMIATIAATASTIASACLGMLPSDHCFDSFVSPLSNPFFFEDPAVVDRSPRHFHRNGLPNNIGQRRRSSVGGAISRPRDGPSEHHRAAR